MFGEPVSGETVSGTPVSGTPHLAWLIRAEGVHRPGDFVSDDTEKATMTSLADAAMEAASTSRLRGKAVLLALSRQLCAVRAMIMLDGVASRIILWPQDEPIADIDATMRAVGADAAVTSWPPAESSESAGDASRDAPEAAMPTEWVLFTSGSTGRPKPVRHTLQTLAGHLIGRPAPGGDHPVWSTFYDVRRYGGLQILLRALLTGGSLVLSSPHEATAAFLTRAARDNATHILGTPSHWRRALLSPAHRLLSPVYVRLSGEVANQAILDQLRSAYPHTALVHAYASTEAGLGFEVSDGLAGFPASQLGNAALGVEVRVLNGSLHLRSSRIALEMLDGATGHPDGEHGFVDTGDEVVTRGERIYFAGRRDGVINVGGQKVHPEEVEAVIDQHPAVQMSRVGTRRNPVTGAVVIAEIVPQPATDGATQHWAPGVLEEAVRSFCRAHLAPHKIPVSVKLVSQLPIAASGKMVRMHA